MPYTISPFLRSPFTDVTGGMVSSQLLGRCQQPEMDMMDCIDAYGLERGTKKCQIYITEFEECQKNILKYKRFITLRKERERKIACGKLTGDKRYVSPKIDAY